MDSDADTPAAAASPAADTTGTPPDAPLPVIRVAVRALAEAIHRGGGLAGPAYGGVSALDGQRLHRRFQEELRDRYPSGVVQIEVPLKRVVPEQAVPQSPALEVVGRCDALIELPGAVILVEAKSFLGEPDRLPKGGEPEHWAQALIAAWIYAADKPELNQIRVMLVYIGLDQPNWVELVREYSRTDLEAFFTRTCNCYTRFAADVLTSQKMRLASGRSCRFPYAELRTGQRQFMQEVIDCVRSRGTLLVQAPTGIGKTMAALFPAVRVLAAGWVDHVFYLTHATNVRLVADQALQDMRRTGLRMRSIILYAKERLCLHPELYCDARICPCAVHYYDSLPAALRELFLPDRIGREEILDVARRHQVCPFELALDCSLYCEIIICDYNHAFDPRVRLSRFFAGDPRHHLLLVDEAHNLPDRSREMYSATLGPIELELALAALGDASPQLSSLLQRMIGYFSRLAKALQGDGPALPDVEKQIPARAVMIADGFRATRELPRELLALCAKFGFFCREFLDQNPRFEGRLTLLRAYFPVLYLMRVADEFWDGAYITAARLTDMTASIELMCLDASEKLAQSYLGLHPTVFLSATLSPMEYYRSLLQGLERQSRTEQLLLDSPFPPENLLVLIHSQLSTRFRQRQQTVSQITALILAAVARKIGNYLVFVPSFAYLSMLKGELAALNVGAEIDMIMQHSDMNESLRRRFLQRFDQYGEKTLVGVAVLGGIFAEGVDLIGEKLSGVIIVGVGLPQLSPERELIRSYFAERLGSGFEYAYVYPGFNKVAQAAGRVIRSDTDRGFVLLIDDRYDDPNWRSLFPRAWNPHNVESAADLAIWLDEFWDADRRPRSIAAADPAFGTVFPSDA